MATQTLDARGLKCPQPTLKITTMAIKMKTGDVLEVVADCPSFEKDVREWVTRSKKTLIYIRDEGDAMRCQIRL